MSQKSDNLVRQNGRVAISQTEAKIDMGVMHDRYDKAYNNVKPPMAAFKMHVLSHRKLK